MNPLSKSGSTPWTENWRSGMLLLLMLGWTALCGCRSPRVVVVASDRVVVPLKASEPFTPAVPGWFVPDARMQELLRKLELKEP